MLPLIPDDPEEERTQREHGHGHQPPEELSGKAALDLLMHCSQTGSHREVAQPEEECSEGQY